MQGVTFDLGWYRGLSWAGKGEVDRWVEGVGYRHLLSVTLLDESGCRGRLDVLDHQATREAGELRWYVVPEIRWEIPFPVGVR